KVRGMWTCIMEVLTSMKKEKELVDSVLDALQGCVAHCILDGKKVVFRVPQLLACRVEGGIDKLCKGNVYEGENLNFLTVIQLLNEALRTLRDERCQSEINQQIWGIEGRATKHKKIRSDLKENSLKIEQEHHVSVSESLSRKEKDWEVKWKNFLGWSPLKLNLQDTVSSVQFI
ncbi:HAUS6 protein, partial [Geococcyx californianus]|nr:HAUS6 protein [Geococcyx californianus]